ncbi:golgin candidate 2-like [Cucurbita pepo subsp. pepo]|uniref:golgin candidate 2-like n=1 Tax=Cucurbita pepo subsp. pepo TaxID=3664 RepID=UPI000C9DA2E9|nr:golgin candidate 2-like [Cucurbita pepo subsp. pepo]
MANWISSKLKAAESILQQIDQQAAESLKKGERPPAVDNLEAIGKTGDILPLKDQLKKKKNQVDNDYHGKLRSDLSLNVSRNQENVISAASKPSPSSKPSTLTDSDWTELLGIPNQPSTSTASRSNGSPTVRGAKRDVRRPSNAGSNMSVLDFKKTQNNTKSNRSLGERKKLTRKTSDVEESNISVSLGSNSRVALKNDKNIMHSEGRELDKKDAGGNISVEAKSVEKNEICGNFDSKGFSSENSALTIRNSQSSETVPDTDQAKRISDMNIIVTNAQSHQESGFTGKHKSDEVSRSSISDGVRKEWTGSSTSGGSSGSDSDSGSASDAEIEREREEIKRRRQKILAEKAAAKAMEAIKEHEDLVARLEGEKQSLEKILEDRARKQAEEASELQTSMMEMMEAVELEKQKHNETRREALAKMVKLETENADLAKTLASVQWNLELEGNRVAGLRQQIELKETCHEELRRRIASSQEAGTSTKPLAFKGIEFELEILEAEHSLITDKVLQLQEKGKKLEEDIELVRKEMEEPTEVEVELKRRLGQMTDHLIQKQVQVEALSSEKATLLFRIEAVTRQLEESKSMVNTNDISSTSWRDLESGKWKLSGSKLRPMLEDKIHSGKKHLGSLIQQLDAIYVAGMVFIRRNPAAKLWSVVYLICLHLWVLYIFMSHSQVDTESKSGAVISLENINTSLNM